MTAHHRNQKQMIPDDDPRWASAFGGYRLPYDSRAALRRLAVDGSDAGAWEELWNELHHQGDLGDASYLAVTALARLRRTHLLAPNHFYGLAATIEVERQRRSNPPVPEWLVHEYFGAWADLVEFALSDLRAATDAGTVQQALAVVAIGKGLLKLGAMIVHQDGGTLEEYLDAHMAWSELYRNSPR